MIITAKDEYLADSEAMLTRRKAGTPRQHCVLVALRGLGLGVLERSQWCTWLGLGVHESA